MAALGGRVHRRGGDPLACAHAGPAEVATAALLHDFGMVVLASHFGKQIVQMLALASETDGVDQLETERVVFGLTHADIGSTVAEAWGLPRTIVAGIRDHHEVHDELSVVSAAVGLACVMSYEITSPRAASSAGRTPPSTATSHP